MFHFYVIYIHDYIFMFRNEYTYCNYYLYCYFIFFIPSCGKKWNGFSILVSLETLFQSDCWKIFVVKFYYKNYEKVISNQLEIFLCPKYWIQFIFYMYPLFNVLIIQQFINTNFKSSQHYLLSLFRRFEIKLLKNLAEQSFHVKYLDVELLSNGL